MKNQASQRIVYSIVLLIRKKVGWSGLSGKESISHCDVLAVVSLRALSSFKKCTRYAGLLLYIRVMLFLALINRVVVFSVFV